MFILIKVWALRVVMIDVSGNNEKQTICKERKIYNYKGTKYPDLMLFSCSRAIFTLIICHDTAGKKMV
jgi:hypothetical protein